LGADRSGGQSATAARKGSGEDVKAAGWLGCAGCVALVAGGGSALVHAVESWAAAPAIVPRWGIRSADGVAACLLALLGTVVFLIRRVRSAKKATQLYWDALESAVDGFLALDGQRRILFVSPQAARLFGYERNELLKQPVEVVLPESAKVLPGPGASRELTGRHKDGNRLFLHGRQGPALPSARGVLVTLILRDVTKTRQTREMLCVREAHLRLIFEQMPAILWTTDTQLRITSTLGAGLAALNVRPEELVGLSMLECLDDHDVESTPIAAHLKAVRGESLSYEMAWKKRTFQVRVDPLRDSEKGILGTVGILLDITDRKQAVTELKRKERQQAAVAALGLRALTGLGLTELMNEAVRAASQTLEAEFGTILEYLPEEKAFRVRAAAGWNEAHDPGGRCCSTPRRATPFGRGSQWSSMTCAARSASPRHASSSNTG
jgi:PAS domain S-box-containing protein